ncbi:hypothetical protein ACFHW2_11505 [Actinomadura sp. LOL_016]|uniref:hypothetical protein n=1 Tax=unclassified Actinomadura TaxID=2626254 RepID=UPI003A80978C
MREHGTRTRYNHGPDENDQPGHGCRCNRCRAANTAAELARVRRNARVEWGAEAARLVDAEPVRAHVQSLMAAGAGWRRIGRAAGLSNGTMSKLLYGTPARPPSRRIARSTAERLMAVRADDIIADGAYVDSAGTVRRLQALVAVGWSISELGRRMDMLPTNMAVLLRGEKVTAGKAREARRLYAELWDQAPPADTPARRVAVSRARNHARALGWPPPAAWDDDIIDLPAAELDAELARRVAAMDDTEVGRCYRAHREGDLSPLIVVGAAEYNRRRKALRKAAATP